jgi:two-component system nitrogen regulation sensor histidine kinase GlnL
MPRAAAIAPQAKAPQANSILAALADAVLVVDRAGVIDYANPAAEQFFGTSLNLMVDRDLREFVPADSPLFALLEQVNQSGATVAENGVTLSSPRIGSRFASLHLCPIPESDGDIAIVLRESSIARKIDQQLFHRNAARSVTAMAAMLAHEVKNPLSGIRGAAQLLEQYVPDADRELTQLICEETDRICALVDRMEEFADGRPIEREPVNIHQVLGHVRKVAQNGFGRHVRFVETYDPSLPAVFGNRDQLIQVFLNLVKNACEANPDPGAEIVLATAYKHGVRLALPGTRQRVHLPLAVQVVDNGPGIAEDLRPHLFDAFITSKPNGRGLGLALVAKIVNDHGGVIEFDSEPRHTVFNVMLPVYSESGRRPTVPADAMSSHE